MIDEDKKKPFAANFLETDKRRMAKLEDCWTEMACG